MSRNVPRRTVWYPTKRAPRTPNFPTHTRQKWRNQGGKTLRTTFPTCPFVPLVPSIQLQHSIDDLTDYNYNHVLYGSQLLGRLDASGV